MSIKLENVEVVGWEAAIRGMRNPMNSWDKSDSCFNDPNFCSCTNRRCSSCREFRIGPNDLDLMKRLRNAGTVHRKFMRMITVYMDVTAPLYWWKEFDTYKVGTVANSCSTMHKIEDRVFTLEDFSHDHLVTSSLEPGDFYSFIYNNYDVYPYKGEDEDKRYVFTVYDSPLNVLEITIKALNANRAMFLKTKDKKYWWQMIQLLPSSYNQRRTIMLNYEVLANIYKSRKSHKLNEWRTLCEWMEGLPYCELITGQNEDRNGQ